MLPNGQDNRRTGRASGLIVGLGAVIILNPEAF